MGRFIFISFAFMAFAFYHLSDGANFDPEQVRMARIELPEGADATPTTALAEASEPATVTRVSLDLLSVSDVTSTAQNSTRIPARQVTRAPNPTVEEPREIPTPDVTLPSLIANAEDVVITPVDFTSPQASTALPTPEDVARDIREVTGDSVNVRGGPGTDYSVVGRMARGDQVVILDNPGNGWVQLQSVDGRTEGWMATFLLSEG